MLCGYSASHCCDLYRGAQALCLENRLRHEPPCRCLCRDCDIKHRLLCPGSGDEGQGASFCLCFQPSDDDHTRESKEMETVAMDIPIAVGRGVNGTG
ncbi:hypothetical protein OPV22_026377 [Ensete ventricosum]|uniref:Uncharacterized protein n=1 Tax=Ensete ventricosum TaxID=4639 RepID=A0AAV8Q6A5_ENSVE|nr:hypothetical protein OPV22_026377 [Ensete ventricosum]